MLMRDPKTYQAEQTFQLSTEIDSTSSSMKHPDEETSSNDDDPSVQPIRPKTRRGRQKQSNRNKSIDDSAEQMAKQIEIWRSPSVNSNRKDEENQSLDQISSVVSKSQFQDWYKDKNQLSDDEQN
jgi:hypothetical protein